MRCPLLDLLIPVFVRLKGLLVPWSSSPGKSLWSLDKHMTNDLLVLGEKNNIFPFRGTFSFSCGKMAREWDVAITEASYTFGETGSEAGAQPWAQAVWLGAQITWTPQEMSGLLLLSELLQEGEHIFD